MASQEGKVTFPRLSKVHALEEFDVFDTRARNDFRRPLFDLRLYQLTRRRCYTGASGVRGGLFGAGGRFKGGTDPIMEKFNESLSFDKRMWAEDLKGSMAYAKATCKVGIITEVERDSMLDGLAKVYKEWESGTFVIKPGDEDIHTANERRLTELIGPTGGKLHTGRSRNDQVATDTRLWTVNAEKDLLKDMATLLEAGAHVANEHIDILMAGYTHL